MFNRLDSLVRQISAWLSNSNLDLNSKTKWLTSVLIGIPALMILATLYVGVVPHIWKEASVKEPFDFTLPLNQDDYVTSYVDYGAARLVDSEARLWEQKNYRRMLPHSTQLDKMHGQYYWIGIQLSSQHLHRAKQNSANIFLAGSLRGDWELYVDSQLIKRGGKLHQRKTVAVEFPEWVMSKNGDIKIAIRVLHNMQDFYPDLLFFTGLLNESEYIKYMQNEDFNGMISNSIAFGINFALGILFLAMWLCGMRKQELAAFSAFGLLHASIQGARLPLISDYIGVLNWHRMSFINTVYEILVVLWLGLSISRIRSKWILISAAVLFAAPWGVFYTQASVNEIFAYVWQLSQVCVPAAYAVAAFLCFGQARLVKAQHLLNLEDSLRILKLYLSSAALILMGLAIFYGHLIYNDYRILNTILFGFLTIIVIHDYRKQELFVRRAPLSKYHQKAQLPASISCVLAAIDLKNSDYLYNFGSEKGVGGAYVVDIINKIYNKIINTSGHVIQTEGDAITFFYETKRSSETVENVIKLISEFNSDLEKHTQECKKKYGSEYPEKIHFRAALDFGAIKPIWQHFEGRDLAGWLQADDSLAFVNVARLLEAEAKVKGKSDTSIVINNETIDSSTLTLQAPVYKIEKMDVTIKHGRIMNISLLNL